MKLLNAVLIFVLCGSLFYTTTKHRKNNIEKYRREIEIKSKLSLLKDSGSVLVVLPKVKGDSTPSIMLDIQSSLAPRSCYEYTEGQPLIADQSVLLNENSDSLVRIKVQKIETLAGKKLVFVLKVFNYHLYKAI